MLHLYSDPSKMQLWQAGLPIEEKLKILCVLRDSAVKIFALNFLNRTENEEDIS